MSLGSEMSVEEVQPQKKRPHLAREASLGYVKFEMKPALFHAIVLQDILGIVIFDRRLVVQDFVVGHFDQLLAAVA